MAQTAKRICYRLIGRLYNTLFFVVFFSAKTAQKNACFLPFFFVALFKIRAYKCRNLILVISIEWCTDSV